MAKCECYVRFLDEVTRFGLHYGAHNPYCPQYQASLDPVDHHSDNAYRAACEKPANAIGAREYERANADYRGESLADLTADIS